MKKYFVADSVVENEKNVFRLEHFQHLTKMTKGKPNT